MAWVATIVTPTVVETMPGTFTVSVEATLTQGAVTQTRTFSQSISATTTAARNEVAAAIAGQITTWRLSEDRLTGFAAALAALKTNIEGRL